MAVLGHSITSLSANRNSVQGKKIDINSSPKIVGVKEKDMDVSALTGNKNTVLGIDFEFNTDYKPEIGSIKMKGEVIYTGNDNKKVVKEWDKNKKLPQDVDIEVKNFLLRKCLLLGVSISQEMQLPPPLVIPTLRAKAEKSSPDYIG